MIVGLQPYRGVRSTPRYDGRVRVKPKVNPTTNKNPKPHEVRFGCWLRGFFGVNTNPMVGLGPYGRAVTLRSTRKQHFSITLLPLLCHSLSIFIFFTTAVAVAVWLSRNGEDRLWFLHYDGRFEFNWKDRMWFLRDDGCLHFDRLLLLLQLCRVIQSWYKQIGAGDSTTAVVRLLYEYDGYDFFVVGIHTMNYGCIFVCCDAGTLRI